jgi:Na+-driven multidrug efflux pump
VVDASDLVRHAIAVGLAFGVFFTVVLVGFGPALYRSLGGEGEALGAAVLYSTWLFAGSVPLWVMNLMTAALRGAGDVRVPAIVSLTGALVLVPLSPALIFGFGPLPALGVAGAAVAVLIYYLGAIGYLLFHLTNGGAPLVLRSGPFACRHFSAILGVGLISALGTVVANLTTLLVTGAVGRAGTIALAGYGVASRIDSLIVPLIFGFGSAVVVMTGAAIGAGDRVRARKVGVHAAVAAFGFTTLIGLAAGLVPGAWMHLFSGDEGVVAAGATYLRIAAPAYGFLGVGLMFYFASQGLGLMTWPFAGGVMRLVLASGGAWVLAERTNAVQGAAIAVAVGAAAFGIVNAIGFLRATRQ